MVILNDLHARIDPRIVVLRRKIPVTG